MDADVAESNDAVLCSAICTIQCLYVPSSPFATGLRSRSIFSIQSILYIAFSSIHHASLIYILYIFLQQRTCFFFFFLNCCSFYIPFFLWLLLCYTTTLVVVDPPSILHSSFLSPQSSTIIPCLPPTYSLACLRACLPTFLPCIRIHSSLAFLCLSLCASPRLAVRYAGMTVVNPLSSRSPSPIPLPLSSSFHHVSDVARQNQTVARRKG